MLNLNCPFYNDGCILKSQAGLPEFKVQHDCKSRIDNCSFFVKEKIKQVQTDNKIKIIIKQVDNVYLVKADGLIYPNNNLLQIDDPLLNRMTLNEAQAKCDLFSKHMIKMGYPYDFPVPSHWKIKQKHFINAVVAGASRLVNEADIISAMKKSILLADDLGLSSLLILPCDNGTHDISLTSLSQLSAIFTFCRQHDFKNIKSIYICMQDEESEQAYIEYYNRIFGEKNDSRTKNNASVNT